MHAEKNKADTMITGLKASTGGSCRVARNRLATACTNFTALPVSTGPGTRFESAGKVSDGEEEYLRLPHTPAYYAEAYMTLI